MCSIGYKSGDRDGHERRLSGWPGEELLWHGLYVKVLRRALISSFYCFVDGVCRLEREFRLNTSVHSGYPLQPHIMFLSFFATFKIAPRMIKMLYLHILRADSTLNWNAFCKLIVHGNYKISKKSEKSVLRYIENITGSVGNFVKCTFISIIFHK